MSEQLLGRLADKIEAAGKALDGWETISEAGIELDDFCVEHADEIVAALRALPSETRERSFSDFIRNATPEEKERVYTDVMKRASERQNAAPQAPEAARPGAALNSVTTAAVAAPSSDKLHEALKLAREWIELEEDRSMASVLEIEDRANITGRKAFNERFVAMCRAVVAAEALPSATRQNEPVWVWGLTQEGMRDEVAQFAALMERKLKANDHKDHWEGAPMGYLLRRLREEVEELERAVRSSTDAVKIGGEAADVGNFAMMIADNMASLPALPAKPLHHT